MAQTRKPAAKAPTKSRGKHPPRARRGGNSGQDRDSHGRFEADHHLRNAAVGAAVTIGAVAAGIAAAFKFGLLDRLLPASEGHLAEDLLIADHPGLAHRAPKDFRPDMDAPMSKADRDALRPAKGTRADKLATADNGVVEPA